MSALQIIFGLIIAGVVTAAALFVFPPLVESARASAVGEEVLGLTVQMKDRVTQGNAFCVETTGAGTSDTGCPAAVPTTGPHYLVATTGAQFTAIATSAGIESPDCDAQGCRLQSDPEIAWRPTAARVATLNFDAATGQTAESTAKRDAFNDTRSRTLRSVGVIPTSGGATTDTLALRF